MWLCCVLEEGQGLGRACWGVRGGLCQEGLGRLDLVQGALHVRPVTLMVLSVLPPMQRHLVTHLPHSLEPQYP